MMRFFLSLIAGVAATVVNGAEPMPAELLTPPIRVMSFNLRYATARDGENAWERRREFLAETIAVYDPDLLGTQETLAVQRDFLTAKMPGHAVVAAGRDDGKDRGEMAALYYRKDRFEKLAEGHFWLSETPDKPGSKGWDAALPRVASWAKLKDRHAPSGLPILFLNTHLDHRGTKARLESARLIRQMVAKLGEGCRVIVTGDFNAGEGSEPYQALFGDESPLIDSYRTAHPQRSPNEGTFSGFKAGATTGARIDWIACSRDWSIRLAGIDRTTRDGRTPSDHYPVTAVLRPAVAGQESMIRVLCWNIHHGEGTDGKLDLLRQARVIRAADPDLVALQEVDHKARRTSGVDQTAELARLTGLHAQFGKQIDFQGGGYGQAILSRFPLGESNVHLLPGDPKQEQRIAFAVQVPVHGRPLLFVSTHLDHQDPATREKQAAKLNELFAGATLPVILAGDLNALPDSKPLALVRDQWTIATKDPALLTFPAGKPNRQIDYVLFRPGQRYRVLAAAVLDEPQASDHRPVLVVLGNGSQE